MNTPNPTPTVNVGATTPTVGALIGGILGSTVAMKTGNDPVTQSAVMTGFATLFTWLFHFLHSKLGTPE